MNPRPVMECDAQADPVARMVRTTTAKEMAAWLVEHHGLAPGSAAIVELNLREQFKWWRLQGRLDKRPFLVVLAKLWRVRSSARELATPARVDK